MKKYGLEGENEMTMRVAAAKLALLEILRGEGRAAHPKIVLERLRDSGFTRAEIHAALQTAMGQNEIFLDKNLKLKAVRTLEAA